MEFWDLFFLFLMGAVIIFTVTGGALIRGNRRRHTMKQPFPEQWRNIMKSNVALYKLLPKELKRELEGRVLVFLEEKEFEGCGDLEITDEIKVTIAAHACILLLNKNLDYYPYLHTILVYPSAYVAKGGRLLGNQVVQDEYSARLGESWCKGAVVLAWEHVRENGRHYGTGHNVVLHEFAHQLDQQNGVSDGVPILNSIAECKEFAEVITGEFSHLKNEVEHGIKDVIDSYGAVNPAEFFAVSTETFFELPETMKKHHPKLYHELTICYKLDPLAWT